MPNRFHWSQYEVMYREKRSSDPDEEPRWIVNRETIRNLDTKETIRRGIIRHPGISVIVPFLDEDRVVLMHQYRYAVNARLWELPAGTLEGREQRAQMIAQETPEQCARRELREETGYEAAQWEKAGECYALPGMSEELMHIFFARGLTMHEQSLDAGEVIEEIRAFRLVELREMIARGEIRDAKTLVGLFLALNRNAAG
jgi:ADP-ribose pyrophosphatase